jgi:hypothetical protein
MSYFNIVVATNENNKELLLHNGEGVFLLFVTQRTTLLFG